MNVTSVKALCWLTSCALAAGLGLFVYDFFSNIEARKWPFQQEHASEVLNREGDLVIETRRSISYSDEVRPAWIRLNWTGKKAPPPPIDKPVEKEPEGPRYTPVADLLTVQLIRYDTLVPEQSVAMVLYIGGGGITEKEGVLMPGDSLPEPQQAVKVSSIDPEGIEFSFEGMERENEVVKPRRTSDGNLILVGDGEPVIDDSTSKLIKRVDRPSFRPAETVQVSPNRWILGTEDAEYLSQNYSEVLIRDVSHRTHYDKNGRRAGIELTHVRHGSVAAKHGAQEGDVVISINGHPVSSAQEAINYAKNNADKYSTWEVVVENLGARRTLIYESPSD